ncbi:MAG: hypothetical protein GWO38_34580, partial [Phycisphaerae bacterium]|nr:hypothetical protein [Phycisphaerae bacterium]NIX32610.1 hypothetical protein [Phycisphaerae bacterium]
TSAKRGFTNSQANNGRQENNTPNQIVITAVRIEGVAQDGKMGDSGDARRSAEVLSPNQRFNDKRESHRGDGQIVSAQP